MDSKCQPALVSSPLLDFLLFQNLLTSLLPLVSYVDFCAAEDA